MKNLLYIAVILIPIAIISSDPNNAGSSQRGKKPPRPNSSIAGEGAAATAAPTIPTPIPKPSARSVVNFMAEPEEELCLFEDEENNRNLAHMLCPSTINNDNLFRLFNPLVIPFLESKYTLKLIPAHELLLPIAQRGRLTEYLDDKNNKIAEKPGDELLRASMLSAIHAEEPNAIISILSHAPQMINTSLPPTIKSSILTFFEKTNREEQMIITKSCTDYLERLTQRTYICSLINGTQYPNGQPLYADLQTAAQECINILTEQTKNNSFSTTQSSSAAQPLP